MHERTKDPITHLLTSLSLLSCSSIISRYQLIPSNIHPRYPPSPPTPSPALHPAPTPSPLPPLPPPLSLPPPLPLPSLPLPSPGHPATVNGDTIWALAYDAVCRATAHILFNAQSPPSKPWDREEFLSTWESRTPGNYPPPLPLHPPTSILLPSNPLTLLAH